MLVSPGNFHRVCDRFGLVCNEEQAREIFIDHGLPTSGCNLYTMAKSFSDATSTPKPQPRSRRGLIPLRERTSPITDPFKLARLPDSAWRAHGSGGAAANAPFATDALPPIPAAAGVKVA